MSKGFVNLANLIPGERYSFTTNDFPGGRLQGTFDRAIHNPGMVKQYFFSNVLLWGRKLSNLSNKKN